MPAQRPTARFRFGPFEADPASGELYKYNIKLKLRQQPFKVLVMLLENRSEVVTREQLRARLWPAGTFVEFDKSLDSAMYRIRSALADSADHPRFIETLPRQGYRFIAPVELITAEDPATGTDTNNTELEVLGSRSGQLTLPVVFALLTLCMLVGLGVATASRNFSSPARMPKRIASLTVVPLKNLTGDPAQDYFADGMTAELTTYLSRISGLRVISGSSMSSDSTGGTNPAEIKRELNVDAVIEGEVLRSGDHVRITTKLVDASTGRELWAQVYERKLDDVLSLESDVTSAVAGELGGQGSGEYVARLPTRRQVKPAAYEDYLRGRHEWNIWTKEGLETSVEEFQQSIRQDPTYAPAWAGLSDAYGLLNLFRYQKREVTLKLMKEAAVKALELDDSSSEAYVSLGTASLSEWSWPAADTELQRAIALDPSNAMAHQWYGYFLRTQGRSGDAIAETRTAVDLDPLDPNKHQALGAILFLAGHDDEALQQYRGIPDGDANSERRHRFLSDIFEHKGMQREAVAELIKGLNLGGKPTLAALVELEYFSSGYSQAKTAFLSAEIKEYKLRAQESHKPPMALQIANDYALLGDKDNAFAWLNEAFRDHEDGLMYLKLDKNFATFRSDRRFQDMVRQIGLPTTENQ
jgi:TolB-like protein/DNA-binding winged helix-turn-helix (wHTH) protein/tetratricopeptide (TPR) repeat protein